MNRTSSGCCLGCGLRHSATSQTRSGLNRTAPMPSSGPTSAAARALRRRSTLRPRTAIDAWTAVRRDRYTPRSVCHASTRGDRCSRGDLGLGRASAFNARFDSAAHRRSRHSTATLVPTEAVGCDLHSSRDGLLNPRRRLPPQCAARGTAPNSRTDAYSSPRAGRGGTLWRADLYPVPHRIYDGVGRDDEFCRARRSMRVGHGTNAVARELVASRNTYARTSNGGQA